jgi:ribosomal protein S18 acetylase RimI-like enzyme
MLTIQAAGIDAIPVIQSIARSSWAVAYKNILKPVQMDYMLKKFYSDSTLQYQINELQFQSVLAVDDAVPVGFATYSAKENSENIFRLHKIYILPDQQGKGIGKCLLNHIIADIKTKDAKILELNVNRNNVAKDFYEKFGFIVIKEEDIDIGNGYFMNDYVMQKSLTS